jgi:hypothetical protein
VERWHTYDDEDGERNVDLSSNPALQATLSSAVTSNLPALLSMRGHIGVRIMKDAITSGEQLNEDNLSEMLVGYLFGRLPRKSGG